MTSLSTVTILDDYSIPEYLAVLTRLLKQRAINIDLVLPSPEECTLQHLQDIVENIFNGRLDAIVYQMAHKEILKNDELQNSSRLLLKKLSPFQVMNFTQVILYKTLPCPREDNCKNKPREIAPSNQYKDEELECPFYHHEKDKRRLPITRKVEDEFIYKANYDKSKCDPFPDKFSKNYFESMFHPIYYRLFQCKRTHCDNSFFCPFFHTKDEKTTWDETFLTYIRKSRDVYTKEKKEKKDSPKNKDEFFQKFEIVALDRKQSPVDSRNNLNLDRVSTRSSTNSSPSSHNDLSEDKPVDDFSMFMKKSDSRNPPGLESFTTQNQYFQYFGEVDKIFMSPNLYKESNVKNSSQSSQHPLFPINQFFNWNTVQNISNVKLYH